jgi:uncharacterized protein YjbI with pentapeptide repeats
VAKLKEGLLAWNDWQDSNGGLVPDLSGLDLHEADLHGFNLSKAALHGADLRGADLCRADLGIANLEGADLRGADLCGADLGGADLIRVNFSDASLVACSLQETTIGATDFSRTVLGGTNFTSAALFETKFTEARIAGAQWCQVDLSKAVDLESIVHNRPSSVGVDTLVMSKGRIPPKFLRGCGLSDWEIENAKLYNPSLSDEERTTIVYEVLRLQLGQPIMFHSVFISYSTLDQEFAAKLHGDLQNAGVRCWFAPHDIASGKKLHEQIYRAIQAQDRLLLVLSKGSMSSEWVKTEIANARAKEKEQKRQALFPIRLVPFDEISDWKAFDADMGKDSAREVREYFIPDFSNWKDAKAYEAAFARLLKDLKASA